MRYVKNRHSPGHEFAPLTERCVHCRWSRQFVVERRARRCPARFQREGQR